MLSSVRTALSSYIRGVNKVLRPCYSQGLVGVWWRRRADEALNLPADVFSLPQLWSWVRVMIKTMRLLGVESLLLHIERGQLSYFGLLIRMPLSGGFLGVTLGSTQSTLEGYCSIRRGTPPEEAGGHGRWACYCNPDPDECHLDPFGAELNQFSSFSSFPNIQ